MKRIIAVVLCLGAVGFTAQPPSGGLRATGVQDLLLTKRSPAWYNEIWSWQFLFDNGMQATLNYTYAKFRFKDPVCGADYSLAGFKGRNFNVGREYPEDRFQQTASPFRMMVHPDMWASGLPPASHHVHFATAKNEGFFVDLEFTQMVPGVAWGDGNWTAGDGDIAMTLPIPSARVKGRIAVGGDTIAVEGWAAMEHIRQTKLVTDILTQSYRGFSLGATPSYINLFHEKDGDWQGFGVQWTAAGPQLLQGNLGIQDGGNNPPPLASIGGMSFKRAGVSQSSSILDGMEGATRWVVNKFVGNVVIQHGKADKPNSVYQYTQVR